MKFKRDYLTSDDLTYILNNLDAVEDEFSKEILKVALTAQILIEDGDWDSYNNCNDIYDKIVSEGINFYDKVKNYYVIDEIIRKQNSVEKVVERFLDGLNQKIDEYSKLIDLSQMETLIGELKKLGSEDKEEEKESKETINRLNEIVDEK